MSDAAIEAFLSGDGFAVAGASNDRRKYGNKVLRCYWQAGRSAFPVNPAQRTIEDAPCFASVSAISAPLHGVSLITPPERSFEVIADAARAGVRHAWFQPGAESDAAIALATEHGMSVIARGPCVLVVLGYDDRRVR